MPLPFVVKQLGAPLAPRLVEPEETFDFRAMKGQAVGDSEDLRRILALPRRQKPTDAFLRAVAADFKQRLGLHNPSCVCRSKYNRQCCDNLLPTQAWALHEAEMVGGLLGPIGVGHGKTLLDLLVPMVAGGRTAVLLLPSALKSQFLKEDWGYYGQHWQLPNLSGAPSYHPGRPFLHVIAFSELSGAKNTDLLDKLAPDVVVVDEAHSVRNRSAARTKRFMRFFKEHPGSRLFCWSGTLTSKSLKDYADLSKYSLREGSPAPRHWPAVEEWAAALDPSDWPSPPGRLLQLGGKTPLEGYQKRLVETAGVVSSGDQASCQASLLINERPLVTPPGVEVALKLLESKWQRPDGDELIDELSKARCARELSCGFYYRWRWPRAEPVPVIERWLAARKAWHKELREKLKTGRAHMDSPLLVTKAAIRWHEGYVHVAHDEKDGHSTGTRQDVPPHTSRGPLPTWESKHWPEWKAVRETAKPETEAVWISDFLVDSCLEWLSEGPGLLWYEFNALASRILERNRGADLSHGGPGDEGTRLVLALRGQERVVISIRSHGTGRNLQSFARNLIANPPAGGGTWEQLLGRTHRQGQEADEVIFDVFAHTAAFRDAIETATDLSRHIEGTFGATQRLASVARWNLVTR